MLAGFDHTTQPQPFNVVGDVLDLVCERSAIGVSQFRVGVGERRCLDVGPEHIRGNLRHQLRCEPQRLRIESGIPVGLGTKWIETRGEVSVRTVGFDQ